MTLAGSAREYSRALELLGDEGVGGGQIRHVTGALVESLALAARERLRPPRRPNILASDVPHFIAGSPGAYAISPDFTDSGAGMSLATIAGAFKSVDEEVNYRDIFNFEKAECEPFADLVGAIHTALAGVMAGAPPPTP
jgi:hypothetical protein